MDRKDIVEWLEIKGTSSNRKFSEGIIKSNYPILGIKVPDMRILAKEIVKQHEIDGLELLSDDTFEEIMLQGFVIGYSKWPLEIKDYFMYNYLCKCDNWSHVDSFASTIKPKKNESDLYYQLVMNWKNDQHEYVRRFVIVFLMDHYIDDEHIDEIIDLCTSLKNQPYQVKMAISWLLATAYINYSDKVLDIINELDEDTYRYTKGKIRDSYRISKEMKERFVR